MATTGERHEAYDGARRAAARGAALLAAVENATETSISLREQSEVLRAESRFSRRRAARLRRPHTPSCEQLVLDHLGLAHALVGRFRGRTHAIEDLDQVAMLGLVNAAARFDPGRGTAFSTYATSVILGELKRYFRAVSWNVHVPRSLQERYLEVRDAADALRREHGHAPTIDEIAHAVGCDVDTAVEAMAVGGAMASVSLHRSNRDDLIDLTDRSDAVDAVTDREALAELLRQLPERERMIVWLRYGEELSQREIGERMGVSQMQVSRLLRRSLQQLQSLADAWD